MGVVIMLITELRSWHINANYPYYPILTAAAETGQILNGIFQNIPATVPGCVHNDLLQAGLIPDPYFEMNSLQCGWVSDYWWTYITDFEMEPSLQGRHIRLRMNGIDYEASISLNGTTIGTHKGMYTPFLCDITRLARFDGANRLTVLLKNSPEEMGQIGYTSRVHTQKARFVYKWDFSTRLVQIGLYDSVCLEHFGSAAIESLWLDAAPDGDTGRVRTRLELTAFEEAVAPVRVEYHVLYEGREIAAFAREERLRRGTQQIEAAFSVDQPRLWYPNGLGEQPLYTLQVSLYDGDVLSDRREFQMGFRTRQYRPADGAPAGCLPYSVSVNGRRAYIKGVNLVPMDIMYGRIQPQTVEHILRMVRDAHCNLVRIWGGGLIESEWFYDLCDRLGLMVWQEFIQSSSGIDNIPSKNPEFLPLCRATAIHAVKQRQHHPSLTFWCGGNELQNEGNVPSTLEDETLRMLADIVDQYDGRTFMLPTSATGFHEFLDIDKPGLNFDVHGPWKYEGPEEYYTVFNASDSQLHSEFGVDGMTNVTALEKCLSPKNLLVQNMSNDVWRYHGEMWDTHQRDQSLFGPLEKERLQDFVVCSQLIQAEGLRYAIEANRRRAYQNVGSIIWQFNEPWPNVSCTNVVDYYGEPKLAYYALQLAYRVVNPNLRYDKLLFAPGEEAVVQVWLSADLPPAVWALSARITADCGKTLAGWTGTVTAGDGLSAKAADLSFAMPAQGAATIELSACRGEEAYRNVYVLFVRNEQGFASREAALAYAQVFRSLP